MCGCVLVGLTQGYPYRGILCVYCIWMFEARPRLNIPWVPKKSL